MEHGKQSVWLSLGISPFGHTFGWFGSAQFMPIGHVLHSVRPISSAEVPGGQTSIFPCWQNRPFWHCLHWVKYLTPVVSSNSLLAKVPFWHNIILAGLAQLYPAGHLENCSSPFSVQFVPCWHSFYGFIIIHIKIEYSRRLIKQLFPGLYKQFVLVLVDRFPHHMGHFETHQKTMDIDDQLRNQYIH